MKSAPGNPPTIYDVAELAGLSIATVSRVLNSPQQVSDETRERVLAAIDELGYVPKAEARARAMQSTRRIGVLTPFFTSPSFVERIGGLDAALVPTQYELIIYTVDSLSRLRGYFSRLPITRSVDGLVVMSLPLAAEDARRLKEHGLETVLIEHQHPDFNSIEIDDYQGGRLAGEYLIAKGHTRLAFMGDLQPPDYSIQPVIKRYEGFRSALAERGLPLQENYVRSSPYLRWPSSKAARDLLSQPDRPTAIFASADIQAISVLKVAGEMGLRVPQDLAILGFDDLEMADYMGLTTIRQSLADSGRIAAGLLMSRLADPGRPVQHIHLPLTIVERETV